MMVRAAAFTDQGQFWQDRLGLPVDRPDSVRAWVETWFPKADALLFIGAAGIAVRAIAPHIVSKQSDPAVAVMDEKGRYVISLLSGHLGGANAFAKAVAEKTGAAPVITTATDLNDLPAIDLWAKESGCAIENIGAVKYVSSRVLKRETVGVMITERTLIPPFPVTLTLRPRTLIVGTGCKKSTDPEQYENAFHDFLHRCAVSPLSVRKLASVDVKKGEEAILRLCARYQWPFETFSADELKQVEGTFAASAFVEKTLGVDNVCERAAKMAGGQRMLMGKTAYEGITFSLWGDKET